MSDDPKTTIAEAIARPVPAGPLEALGYAADWAAQTVLPAVGDDDAAAFECVVALDEALPKVDELLRRLPDLIRIASPGQAVSGRLAAAEAEFTRHRTALADERGRLEAARHLEQRAAELEMERARLRERIGQLERSHLIERELPALQTWQAELEAVVSHAAAATGEELVRTLEAGARRLLELTEEQASLIAADNGRLVSDVAAAADSLARELARRDELAAELADREREAAQLQTEQQRILPGLQARQQADVDLLTGLDMGGLPPGTPAAGRVRAQLAEIEQRITEVEASLKPLLKRHAQAYEEARQIRSWTS
jgi:hypothetical protein